MKTGSRNLLLLLLVCAALACRAVTGQSAPTRSLELLVSPTFQAGIPAAQPRLLSTWTAVPFVVPTVTPGLALSASTPTANISDFQVRVHPDGGLVVGDLVSFEVIAPTWLALDDETVEISVPGQAPFTPARFGSFGIAGRTQATFNWAWDTRGLQPGSYSLEFALQPGGQSWTETISLLPPESLPQAVRQAAWAQARSDCCVVNYMTGTAAGRDLDSLLLLMDEQAQEASDRMGIALSEPITVTLLPRLLGHGGFANNEIHISYLDRNYAGSNHATVLHHEMIHVLDARQGGDLHISLLVEGLAVFMTGGHFKPEPLMPRAAALLDAWGTPPRPGLGWYIPLKQLFDDFYRSQHESGYLQAGALVEFMVETWGWQAFAEFYGDIHANEHSRQSQAVDEALQAHFNLDLEELEGRFLAALHRLPADSMLAADVRLSVQFYDAVRRYQQALDPSAYFLTAWLLDTAEMRQRGIVADYLRHPAQPANLALETLLASAAEDLVDGRYRQAEQVIAAVNAVLDALQNGWPDPFSASLLASDYAAVVQAVLQNPNWAGRGPGDWIEPQRIWVDADQARVWLTAGDSSQVEVLLERDGFESWDFISANNSELK